MQSPACLEVSVVTEEVCHRVNDHQAQGWAGRVLDEVFHAAQALIQILPCGNVPLHIYIIKRLSRPAVPAWYVCTRSSGIA